MTSGKAQLAGVIGWPVGHSLSPKLHGYWLKQYGIDGAYVPLSVRPEQLGECMRALPLIGNMRGVNLTLPHKEAVLPMLVSLDAAAQAIGAANTIIFKEGACHGMNSDAYGFIQNIRPYLTGKGKAVVLGAGGAAKAVCYALTHEGFGSIVVVNRTAERAQALVKQYTGVSAGAWDEREALLEGADLLVNTTSLGLSGKEPLSLALAALPKQALVTDIVYTPRITPLLVQAQAHGNPIVDGLGMLLHQAVPAFEAWFGVRPEVSEALKCYMND